ncbi:MAG TPA: glycoside hydrolase family 43 protein [Pyrinomonadaceae bacterium]|nr:glycoside hydrolase family 43 protein [Pyrinomonadaceae bacterium]
MPDEPKILLERRYVNPVYAHSFPDPYILKFRGEYYAYCTGFGHDGRVFGILYSRDLVNWREVGGAMHPLDSDAPFYWAPEVTYNNGKFYLYYSVGNEVLMHLRVAVSDRPDGGFIDSGTRLTQQDFAIDAHVFTDEDGSRYMFYATDFLEYKNIGTGTVVDRMVDWFSLAGDPQPVTRAQYDWQVYDPHRIEKGGVRWYTVEGPFVLKRKNLYYEMFSGGNWQNTTYGVSFAVSDTIESGEEWAQFSDGEKILPILRTLPGKVIGPGHNSAIRGPNNRENYCIYHSWTANGRVLAIDRMDFAGPRLYVAGPSYEPQPAPFLPTVNDHFDGNSLNENWTTHGEWRITAGEAISGADGENRLVCNTRSNDFVCEVSLRFVKETGNEGAFGIVLYSGNKETLKFLIVPYRNAAVLKGSYLNGDADLTSDFLADTIHLLRIETNHSFLRILLDDVLLFQIEDLEQSPTTIAFATDNVEAAFSGFALTEGFEDLFEHDNESGWALLNGKGTCHVQNGELFISSQGDAETVAAKMRPRREYEFAINLRLDKHGKSAALGFVLLDRNQREQCRIDIGTDGKAARIKLGRRSKTVKLPSGFAPGDTRQFGILIKDGEMIFRIEDLVLGKFAAPQAETAFGIYCKDAAVAIEMARLTVL